MSSLHLANRLTIEHFRDLSKVENDQLRGVLQTKVAKEGWPITALRKEIRKHLEIERFGDGSPSADEANEKYASASPIFDAIVTMTKAHLEEQKRIRVALDLITRRGAHAVRELAPQLRDALDTFVSYQKACLDTEQHLRAALLVSEAVAA